MSTALARGKFEMKNQIIISFVILEAVLFFSWAIFVFGRGKISKNEKKLAFILFVTWIGVLAAAILCGIIGMLLYFFKA
jgi:drug/metabolite transporter (DMT)-like permease